MSRALLHLGLKAEGGIRTLNPRFTKAVLCH